MFTVYILHSKILDKYYIGFTSEEVNVRLSKHLSNHSGFTGKAKDWLIVYTESFPIKALAMQREKEIKKWKSKKKIEQLIGSTE